MLQAAGARAQTHNCLHGKTHCSKSSAAALDLQFHGHVVTAPAAQHHSERAYVCRASLSSSTKIQPLIAPSACSSAMASRKVCSWEAVAAMTNPEPLQCSLMSFFPAAAAGFTDLMFAVWCGRYVVASLSLMSFWLSTPRVTMPTGVFRVSPACQHC